MQVEESKAQASLHALGEIADQDGFMNSYVAEIVRVHEDALKQYDAELLPAAKGSLKISLERARSTIAGQLERAQALALARY